MNIEALIEELRMSKKDHSGGTMEEIEEETLVAASAHLVEYKRSQNERRPFLPKYFNTESLLLLICLTASLLILPLILPPLPPPPIMLMLLPIGIFAVLMIFAFMPYDVRDITSSCL